MNTITIEEKHEIAVSGWIRKHRNEMLPADIIRMIFNFYFHVIDSVILDHQEQNSLFKLLNNRLNKDTKSNKTYISLELLYRASENSYDAEIFHEKCDNKGATVVIIENEYDEIYGGFTSVSWDINLESCDDPKSFLYSIKPKLNTFELNDKSGKDVITNYPGDGPIFGTGSDLWICNNCNKSTSNGVNPSTYDFIKYKDLAGVKYRKTNSFTIKDYEVFSVEIIR